MMAGSPGFQSPEQLRAESLGPPCDVYAFGCVVIVLMQERVLWPQLTQYQILLKVSVRDEHPDTSQMPANLKELSHKCLQRVAERPKISELLGHLLLCIS